jgi:hypothetical protein
MRMELEWKSLLFRVLGRKFEQVFSTVAVSGFPPVEQIRCALFEADIRKPACRLCHTETSTDF